MAVFDFIHKRSDASSASLPSPVQVPQPVTPPGPAVSATDPTQVTMSAPVVNTVSYGVPLAQQPAHLPSAEEIAATLRENLEKESQMNKQKVAQENPKQDVKIQADGVGKKEETTAVSATPPIAKSPDVAKAQKEDMSRQALLDVMAHLTQRANKVLVVAQNKAKELASAELDSEHLLHALLSDGQIYKMFVDMKIQPQNIEAEITKNYKHGTAKTAPQLSPRAKRIIGDSLLAARKGGFEFIAPEHMLLALFEEGEGLGARVLANLGVDKTTLEKAVYGQKGIVGQVRDTVTGAVQKAQEHMSAIQQYTIDITAKAAAGQLDPVVERSEEIERVIHVLSRRTKNNPALIGEPGVGKTAIVEGLAQKIVAKQVPESLMDRKLLQLDLMSVLAGASHRGEFEERMKHLIEEVVASKGKIVMFIDEMHTIVGAGAGGEGSMDAANFLKPALARGDLQMIGATTITEYRRYIEKDPALERRFQTVMIPEPTVEQAIKMLKATRDKYEAFHRVKIPDSAIESAVFLSKRYVGDRFLPDKAIDLVDEAASAVRLPLLSLPEEIQSLETRITQLTAEMADADKTGNAVKARTLKSKLSDLAPELKEKQDEYAMKKAQSTAEVTESIIKDVVSRWTGIPVSKLTGSQTDKLARLEDIMHERMIGQERPVKSVAAAVRRGRAGLKSNKRPIGSFIFMGPSGVGKTELAKTLAEILFGQEEAMIRFDMTEFMEKHEVAKLIGPPPGYVGFEEGGKLTEAVRRKPYCVVLFDEIEKAHPDIFNILLQILDDGRLTDNKGRTISFKNTVVICTSNIGTQIIQDELLKDMQAKEQLQKGEDVELLEENGKKVARLTKDVQPHEYVRMNDVDIALAYRKAKQNLDEPELVEGHQFEDEAEALSMEGYERIKTMVMGELRKFFRPELINRFDEVIVFEPLQLYHMKKILALQIKTLAKLLGEQDLGLVLTDAALEQVVESGFDPIYGARPLRRAIQKLLEDPISELIIAKKATPGDVIAIDYRDGDFVFDVQKLVLKTSNAHVKEKREVKKFKCMDSGYEFETLVTDHSCTICPLDVKQEVEEVIPVRPKASDAILESAKLNNAPQKEVTLAEVGHEEAQKQPEPTPVPNQQYQTA